MSDSLSPHLGGSNPMEDHSGSDIPVRMIVETAMDGIISMDANQNIVLFNSAAEAIFGWRAAEVIGQSIDKLIPGRFRTDHREVMVGAALKPFGLKQLSLLFKLRELFF